MTGVVDEGRSQECSAFGPDCGCNEGRTTSPRLLPVCARCGARRDLLPCCDRHQHVLCRECYLLATADPINCGVEVPDA